MSDTTTDSTTVPARRKGVRRALWTAGTLLALSAVAYLATPPIARHYAQKHLGEVLGREVSIERVLVNPFRLTAELGGVRVMEADGSGEALAFDALRANLEIESIVRKGIVLHELALVAQPHLAGTAFDHLERIPFLLVAEPAALVLQCLQLLHETIMPAVQYYAYVEITDGPPQNLWHAYAQVAQMHRNFAQQRIVSPADIFPVFRELFRKQPK